MYSKKAVSLRKGTAFFNSYTLYITATLKTWVAQKQCRVEIGRQ